MPKAVHFRIGGHVATLLLHGANSLVMLYAMQDKNLLKDPQIRTMASMQETYFTVWNFTLQMIYAALGLCCDLATVLHKEHLIPKTVRGIRYTMFATAIFPQTVTVFSVFWPLFLYDRSLLYPEFIDKILSFRTNMIMHFWILPLALWELLFLPRTKPASHVSHLLILAMYFVAYNVLLLWTYYSRNLWPYPMFKSMYGTIYYPLFMGVMASYITYIYYKQWKLSAYFSAPNAKTK